MSRALVLYAPVLHEGYLKLFRGHAGELCYVLDGALIAEFMPLHKEIRALDPEIIRKLIETLGIFAEVRMLGADSLASLSDTDITMPDEAISRSLAAKYFSGRSISFEPVFLRWDEANVKSSAPAGYSSESADPFDREMVERARNAAETSSDWWRHVGAVVVKDKQVILEAGNHHVPSDHTPYIEGDPRDFIPAGERTDLSTVLHSEQAVIAAAAQKGISLAGADLYVNVFPCPVCAKMVAFSGIKRCFFSSGHASLDGERILKAKGVEIVLVK